jgi:hypothetical protein
MEAFIVRAREALERDYGAQWLHEVVGFSQTLLENAYYKRQPTAWGRFVAEAIREAGDAELSLDATQFQGFDQPVGPITREQLFVMYPRIFEFSKRYGWTVYTVTIEGWVLRAALEAAISAEAPIQAAGLTYKLTSKGKPYDFKVSGRKLVGNRRYKVAMPEGFVRGAFGITKLLRLVLQNATDTGVPIWFATEAKLRREGVIKPLPPVSRGP